jgi:hypothetical protein
LQPLPPRCRAIASRGLADGFKKVFFYFYKFLKIHYFMSRNYPHSCAIALRSLVKARRFRFSLSATDLTQRNPYLAAKQ